MTIKVLIAEDSAFIRKKISQILSSHDSIEVVDKAKNGKEAVKLTLQSLPDVLVLDLLMPKMSGLEAFKRIIEEYPVPTIVLSSVAPGKMDSSIQALLIGAFDYIIKPGTLKGEQLEDFKDILVNKVKLAYNSQFKKVYEKMEESTPKISFRQKRVNEIFKFGKLLKKIETSSKKESQEKVKKIEDLSKTENRISISELKTKEKSKIEGKIPKKIQNNSKEEKYIKKKKEEPQPKPKATKIKDKVDKKIKKPKKREQRPREKQKVKNKHKKVFKSEEKNITQSASLRKDTLKSKRYPDKLKKELSSEVREEQKTISAIELLSDENIQISRSKLHRKIIVMGASVGGPQTIKQILKEIPENFPYPIIIVQHLNSKFIHPFALSLGQLCPLPVRVAQHNELIKSGVIYIAPGERHLKVSTKNQKPCIKLFDDVHINFCKPSIDVLFVSSVQVYKNRVIGILLTGMGRDGVEGLEWIRDNNGLTIAESQDTAILYGMPKLAVERGIVHKTLPNKKISEILLNLSSK